MSSASEVDSDLDSEEGGYGELIQPTSRVDLRGVPLACLLQTPECWRQGGHPLSLRLLTSD